MSAPRSLVYAVDAVTGKTLWKFDPHVKMSYGTQNSYAVRVNRGVAVWQGSVFVATGDCRLVAIDANSGQERWPSPICDPVQTGSMGAPHVAKGKVLIGYNGSDDMVRGSLVAFDARSGKEAWRFWTVPGDQSKGFESKALEGAAKTWSGNEWWRFGGGAVWDAITYDPRTNLINFGTAGSGQVEGTTLPGQVPHGAKLFAGCVMAVNADTGKLLEAKLYGSVHWASAIDLHTGRPVERTDAASGAGAERGAGKTWWPMSYDPLNHLVYIPAYDVRRHQPGDTPLDGHLVAWDPIAQSVRWSVEQPLQANGGVLSTAGNLVFQGEGIGEFAAYSGDSGRKVWSIQTGSAIESVPISYRLHRAQYIFIPVGWGSASRLFMPARTMATPKSKRGPARLLAFKLGGTLAFPTPADAIPEVPLPPEHLGTAAGIEQGEKLYETHLCAGCHAPELDGSGAWTVDGAIPDLRYAPAEVHRQWEAIVLGGSHRAQGMMAFGIAQHYPDITALTPEDARAIHAYIIDEAWKAYDSQKK